MKNIKSRFNIKGISLIVLVITIIVMIILAGAIIISLTSGNVIAKAKEARDLQDFKQIKEQLEIEKGEKLLAESLGNTYTSRDIPLGSYADKIIIDYTTGLAKLTLLGESLRTNTAFQETLDGLIVPKGPNVPKLTDGMTPITFDSNGQVVLATSIDIEKAVRKATKDPSRDSWYDYADQGTHLTDGKTSNWANVKLADESQFVWIPRYAYKITYYTSSACTTLSAGEGTTKTLYGKIGIAFLAGTSNYKANDDGTIGDKVGTGSLAGYIVHPAFANNIEAGGWDKELTGIWIAKYEAGLNSASEVSTVNSKKYPVFKPLQYSYNIITIGDSYSLSRALTVAGNPYGLTTKADSHLMKNSEWGAVAYLAHSQYGRNGTQVRINNYNLNGAGGYYGVTGIGASPSSEGQTIPEDTSLSAVPVDNRYNGQYGKLASTTGNVYGIYDMSGGHWERVTGYIQNPLGASSRTTYGTSLLTESGSTKYKTVYAYDSTNDVNTSNYIKEINLSRKGEAIWETSLSGAGSNSWFSDYSIFTSVNYPFLVRGGSYGGTSSAGLFGLSGTAGSVDVSGGFRPALVI